MRGDHVPARSSNSAAGACADSEIAGPGPRAATRAVELTLTDGNELLIGSDHPMRLHERIQTLAGRNFDEATD